MRSQRSLVPAILVVLVTLTAQPARASCGQPEGSLRRRLAAADTVFVGTVVRVGAGDRVATVHVESVWQGEVADQVQVTGGETSPGVASSGDRHFAKGRRYLFVPWRAVNPAAFDDEACSDTRPWRDRLDRLRPPAAAPIAGGDAGEQPLAGDAANQQPAVPATGLGAGTVATGLGALVVLAGVAALLGRRRAIGRRARSAADR
jgi:hypothetical protein